MGADSSAQAKVCVFCGPFDCTPEASDSLQPESYGVSGHNGEKERKSEFLSCLALFPLSVP